MKNNVVTSSFSELRPCTSCQICSVVCPTQAISIQLNDVGFYRPVVDQELCIECGVCMKHCYKYDATIGAPEVEGLKSIKYYACVDKDDSAVAKSTSGGVAGLLATVSFDEGHQCAGVAYDLQTHRAVFHVAQNRQELNSFRGSKYIQAYSAKCFREIISGVREDDVDRIVFGLPCQIYALDSYLKAKKLRHRFLLVDLFCHGCPSMNIWQKTLIDAKGQTDKEIKEVAFRSKNGIPWGRFSINIKDSNGEGINLKKRGVEDGFYELFFSNQLLNDSCATCKLRGNLSHSDIRLGDFWGASYISNTTGVSLVAVQTESGARLFDQIREKISCQEHSYVDFMYAQSLFDEYPVNTSVRARLLTLLADPEIELQTVVDEYFRSQSYTQKVKRHIKGALSMLPYTVTLKMKSWLYNRRKNDLRL